MFEALRGGDKSIVIAEVGQNHQGSFETAVQYIRSISLSGADFVKFQMRDNKTLFTHKAYNQLYNSENSFAKTYGEHREALELTKEELKLLRKECEKQNIGFMCTPFDEVSLEWLTSIGTDIIKVASFDLANVPFLDLIGKTKTPVIMSTGGGNLSHVRDSLRQLNEHHNDVAILHCVSEYPTHYSRLGLNKIIELREMFPNNVIGLSDHFNGISSGVVGFMKGARIFEKHVTLDRSWKGTDHSFSLEINGFTKFVRDIRRTPEMFQAKPDVELGYEPVFKRLGKVLSAKKFIGKGELLTIENLSSKICVEEGIPVRKSSEIIGAKVKEDIPEGALITIGSIVHE